MAAGVGVTSAGVLDVVLVVEVDDVLVVGAVFSERDATTGVLRARTITAPMARPPTVNTTLPTAKDRAQSGRGLEP
jgi:hypothetical protein